MSRRTLVLSTLAAAAAAFAIAFAIAANRGARAERPSAGPQASASASASGALPVLWQVPSFSFVDQNGRATTASDLRGHVWIADFVFTTCTTICPLITAKMAVLQRRLNEPALRFVSFSVDPTRDTPEALKRYATAWRPDESRWTLLATDKKGLDGFAASMFVIVEPGEKDIGHSKLFFLVDAQGAVRGIYESDQDEALERLVRDARRLTGKPFARPPTVPNGNGAELYASLGCGACHARAELAPPLEGLVGRRVKLASGGEIIADAAYVRESIVTPDAKLVAGHVLRMPGYGSDLTPQELDALVDHVASLKAPVATRAAPKSSGPSAPGETAAAAAPTTSMAGESEAAPAPEPAMTAVDPVCSMSVRVTTSTPRATHEGRTIYFCSEMCRERFVAEPARFTKAAPAPTTAPAE
jgi:protein SCO1/2